MDTTELLKKVRKIEIKTKGLSKQIFSGEYSSAFKGRGMSFSEVRSYQYGDDVRNIDWNVTARTGEPHVKIFEEERELTVILLVDVSKSVYFGTAKQMKSDLITEICAVISFSAINNNDKVGVLFFSDKIEKFIPPKKGRQHILRIIRELVNFEPESGQTNIAMALEYFNNVIKKRCICFLLSDFQDDAYEDALKIVARRHDIIGLNIYDDKEKQIPRSGFLIRFQHAESGKGGYFDPFTASSREKYEKSFTANQKYFKEAFIKSGADSITLVTNKPYVNVLLNFFKKRSN